MKSILNLSLPICLALLCVAAPAQVDVARETTAITYPQEETVNVKFRGTTRFPRMKGEAEIRRTKKNITEIELKVFKMPRPFELGAGYATYVLWAVSPEGQIDSLGEIRRRGAFEFDSSVSVTTRFQTFALILTAEPHFLVRQPSQAIMLENLSPYSKSGSSLVTTRTVQYFGNSSDYFRDARTPQIAEVDFAKTPSTLLQAIHALALARYAGAERDAAEELAVADERLNRARQAWKDGRDEEEIDILGRQAISSAVEAEGIAILRGEARQRRNERTRADEEIREAEGKYSAAAREIEALKSEVAREIRNRELVERDLVNTLNQNKELKEEIVQIRETNTKLKVEADAARLRAEKAEKAKLELESKMASESREDFIKESFTAMTSGLRRFGAVADDGSRLVLTIADSIWSGPTSRLTARGSSQVAEMAKFLADHPGFRIVIESHLDDQGAPDGLVALTQKRAEEIAGRMAAAGIPSDRIQTEGLGASTPLVPNKTASSRAKNRRTNIFIVPDE